MKATSSTKPSADNISNGLSQLVTLYYCMDDLLDSVSTKNLISSHQNDAWVEEVMEGSLKLLDVCNILRDVVLEIEEHVRHLQCALRRRKCHNNSDVQISIKEYNCFRKKTMKQAKDLIMSLKQSEKVMGLLVDPSNHHLASVIRVFMEVTEMVTVIFEHLLIFLVSRESKANGWSLMVSKMISKREDHAKDEGTANELQIIDVALRNILCNGREESLGNTRIAQVKLEELQAKMMRIENGLDCMFRRFMKMRSSLLNIISM